MQLKPQITFRDIPHSDAIETQILNNVSKLEKFYDRIMQCEVVVEQVQKHKNNGKIYNIKIMLSVPGDQLVVNHARHENIYVSIRNAFDSMRRRLQGFAKRRRGKVKTHEVENHGKIARIIPGEDYGFIESNGSEYYFSFSNMAHDDFEALEEGQDVHFLESYGNEGFQANHVIVDKH